MQMYASRALMRWRISCIYCPEIFVRFFDTFSIPEGSIKKDEHVPLLVRRGARGPRRCKSRAILPKLHMKKLTAAQLIR